MPIPWVIGTVGILGCCYLFYSLPVRTQSWFLGWNLFGLVVYWLYGSARAEKARAQAA